MGESRVTAMWPAALALVMLVGCVPAGGGGGDDDAAAPPPRDRGAQLGDVALDDARVADAGPVADMDPVEGGDMSQVDAAPRTACNDGLDNDRDGLVDFPDDPGCESAADDDEAEPPPATQCADRLDNDGDGLIDTADSDCNSAMDDSESGGATGRTCSNGADDDGDGLTDFPFDPGCLAAGHISEADRVPPPQCANGEDDDGDGNTDFPADPGCVAAGDETEAALDPPAACADGVDNDQSGAADWPDDPGCEGAGDLTEISPCGPDNPVVDLNRHLAGNPDFIGDLSQAPAGLVGTCGGAAGGEFAFIYTVERRLERVIFDTRHPETEAPVVMYLRDRCRGSDLQCDRGLANAPGVALVVEQPPVGAALYVVVDTGSRDAVGRFKLTVDAVLPPQCRDEVDNDDDGLLDAADPGCAGPDDADEADPEAPPVCSNGLDDDMDGLVDWPADPDCVAAGAPEEAPPCRLDAPLVRIGQDGGEFPLEIIAAGGAGAAQPSCEPGFGAETVIVLTLSEPSDVDFQVFTAEGAPAAVPLHARSVCEDPETELECRAQGARMNPLTLLELDRGVHFLFAEQGFVVPQQPLTARVDVQSVIVECNDLVDNDADGAIDLADIGCEFGRDDSERDPGVVPQCADGLDNDGNGQIDWPADEGCLAAGDMVEDPPGVPLGRELGFGHHGSCDSWNQCGNAVTCANAACTFFGHGPALEFQDGLCQDLARVEVPNLTCSLFRSIPRDLDQNWRNSCNIPVVYDVVCAPD